MSVEMDLMDQLDRYIKGVSSSEENSMIEERMAVDPDFRRKVEQHRAVIDSLKLVKQRDHLKKILEDADGEMGSTRIISINKNSRKFPTWIMIGVAASVAVISVLATLMVLRPIGASYAPASRSLDQTEQIDQIEQSQKKIMKDLSDIKKKINPSPGKYAGTGFLISSKGYAATSYHVVKDADSILVENEKYGLLKARIVYSDPANDISIFLIDSLPSTSIPYVVSGDEASIAEEVYTLGFPREDIVFGDGSISALTGYRQSENSYQISVPVNPGNSGGPLLNSKGDLIGMISGIQTQTFGTAFAVKSSMILDAIASPSLDSLRTPITLSKANSLKNNSRVQQVAKWKSFVFMVRVYKN